jgi:hypothetical protein
VPGHIHVTDRHLRRARRRAAATASGLTRPTAAAGAPSDAHDDDRGLQSRIHEAGDEDHAENNGRMVFDGLRQVAGRKGRKKAATSRRKPGSPLCRSREPLSASVPECRAFPLKAKCCPNMPGRRVVRDVNEAARDVARNLAKTGAFARSRRDRKKIEMLFAPQAHFAASLIAFARPERSAVRVQFGSDRTESEAPRQDR